jgi:hypothetical protein
MLDAVEYVPHSAEIRKGASAISGQDPPLRDNVGCEPPTLKNVALASNRRPVAGGGPNGRVGRLVRVSGYFLEAPAVLNA